ncbi:outer membrane protein assembly factor BamB family protein [Jatrophihabitans fulvus]
MPAGRAALATLVLAATVAGCTADAPDTRPSGPSGSSSSAVAARTLPPSGARAARPGPVVWDTLRTGLGRVHSIVARGSVTVLGLDGNRGLAAVATATGRVLWRTRSAYDAASRIRGGDGRRLSTLVRGATAVDSAVGPLLVVGYEGGPERDGHVGNDLGVAALRLRDGRLMWSNPVGFRGGRQNIVSIRGADRNGIVVDVVPLGNPPAAQVATLRLDAATGRTGWQVPGSLTDVVTGDVAMTGVVREGSVALGDGDRGVRSGRDLRTGRVVWTAPGTSIGAYVDLGAITAASVTVRTGVLSVASGRVRVPAPGPAGSCVSDGSRLIACDVADRLLTIVDGEAGFSAAARALGAATGFEDHTLDTVTSGGRIWVHDERGGSSVALDRSGTTVVGAVPGHVVAGSGRWLYVAESDSSELGRVDVYRLG